MSKRIKHLSLKAGLLSSLLIVCQLAAYAYEDTGQSIIVSTPESPDHPVKLRPFVRNRVLPSRAEMVALQEERAQMAEQAQSRATLNGKISAFADSQATNYDSVARITNSTRRVSHNRRSNQAAVSQTPVVNTAAAQFCMPYMEQAPSLPAVKPINTLSNNRQGFSFLRTAEQHLTSVFSHSPDTSASRQIQPAATPQFSETVPAYPAFPPVQMSQPMTNQPLSLSVSPVSFTPSMSETSAETSGFGTAGPPPFPLNLLPAPALKQLIRSMAYGAASHAGSAPPSYFGSWHNSSTFGTNTPVYANGSPQGSFHSYLQIAYSHRNIRSRSAPSAVTTSHRNSHARKNPAKTSHAKLISYPAYPTQSIPGFNLPQ